MAVGGGGGRGSRAAVRAGWERIHTKSSESAPAWGERGRDGWEGEDKGLCSVLSRCGEIWGDTGDMGRYGETQGYMRRYGEIWGDMGRYGEIWVCAPRLEERAGGRSPAISRYLPLSPHLEEQEPADRRRSAPPRRHVQRRQPVLVRSVERDAGLRK